MSEEISIRFARLDDLEFAYQDGHIPAEVLKQKIDAQTALNPDCIEDVVIAEWNGKRVGYTRLAYLWSIVPYSQNRPDPSVTGISSAGRG